MGLQAQASVQTSVRQIADGGQSGLLVSGSESCKME